MQDPSELDRSMLRKRISHKQTVSFNELFDHVGERQLLSDVPESWAEAWNAASAHSFQPSHR